ncbi:MAG TPA: YpdA family putative bacillithiol disulfide reductase [Thermoanaerobaculia bacterium]|nr:YpdA family putative bacillithiol disulfide reductase [Thermoanaerobaculia bacterium]
MNDPELLDLLVVGAGPTGIAIGAEARQAGLSVLLVDRGPLTAAIQAYPTFIEFFTTRDRLEIAGVPFAIPEAKPSRRQALVYYRSVVERYGIPLALHEDVRAIERHGDGFLVRSERSAEAGEPGEQRRRRARAVALATGYFDGWKRLGVPGESQPWVHHRYVEPYPYFDRDVVIVGAGNTAAEAAVDLWRNGARVTLVHRRDQVKPGVKYWLKPDVENRIAEGSIRARFRSVVQAFGRGAVEITTPDGEESLPAQAAFVLIGYVPDADLQRRSGIDVDAETLVPSFDPETCETNVPGLYVAGTIQAGRNIDRIFIENSREHGPKIVRHLRRRLDAGALAVAPALSAAP